MFSKKVLTPNQALEKIKYFCAYQERCHKEVTDKLYGFGIYGKEVEQIIATLIEENYLNEERFAIAFAGGKFRVKQWGRQKIKHELKLRGVSNYCINMALAEIDEESYIATLIAETRKKWESLRKEVDYSRQARTNVYLLMKGYEQHLIIEVIERLKKGETE